MTIGQVAARAGVATSAVRYYERRGLLVADARQSGQRRYTPATLRRLVFIGMLQDAGLALDEIAGILDAPTVADWKAIAARRHYMVRDFHRNIGAEIMGRNKFGPQRGPWEDLEWNDRHRGRVHPHLGSRPCHRAGRDA